LVAFLFSSFWFILAPGAATTSGVQEKLADVLRIWDCRSQNKKGRRPQISTQRPKYVFRFR
jgi:hypothetical protein